jgi:hypothetical protein
VTPAHMPPDIRQVAQAVAVAHGITVPIMLAPRHRNKAARFVAARREFAWRLRRSGYKYSAIAGWIGCTHSTVISLLRGGQKPPIDQEIQYPDLSGEWAI